MGAEHIVEWLFVFMLVFGGGGTAFVRNQLEHRRRTQLEMKKHDRAIAEARAAEARTAAQQQALTVRAAELEIERFGRSMVEGSNVALPRLPSSVDPDLLHDAATNVGVNDTSTLSIIEPPTTNTGPTTTKDTATPE